MPFIREILKHYTHIEIESLPGGSWGYSFYEMAARYERNLGLETMGMTGAFHRSWVISARREIKRRWTMSASACSRRGINAASVTTSIPAAN